MMVLVQVLVLWMTSCSILYEVDHNIDQNENAQKGNGAGKSIIFMDDCMPCEHKTQYSIISAYDISLKVFYPFAYSFHPIYSWLYLVLWLDWVCVCVLIPFVHNLLSNPIILRVREKIIATVFLFSYIEYYRSFCTLTFIV